jgi:hypothetical protein
MQVLIIAGETGCGKTTQVSPLFLLDSRRLIQHRVNCSNEGLWDPANEKKFIRSDRRIKKFGNLQLVMPSSRLKIQQEIPWIATTLTSPYNLTALVCDMFSGSTIHSWPHVEYREAMQNYLHSASSAFSHFRFCSIALFQPPPTTTTEGRCSCIQFDFSAHRGSLQP